MLERKKFFRFMRIPQNLLLKQRKLLVAATVALRYKDICSSFHDLGIAGIGDVGMCRRRKIPKGPVGVPWGWLVLGCIAGIGKRG